MCVNDIFKMYIVIFGMKDHNKIMIILNMNFLFALFSKLYYVTKIHIILDLLLYNYLYAYKYGNLTIFTVYILLTVVMVQN